MAYEVTEHKSYIRGPKLLVQLIGLTRFLTASKHVETVETATFHKTLIRSAFVYTPLVRIASNSVFNNTEDSCRFATLAKDSHMGYSQNYGPLLPMDCITAPNI